MKIDCHIYKQLSLIHRTPLKSNVYEICPKSEKWNWTLFMFFTIFAVKWKNSNNFAHTLLMKVSKMTKMNDFLVCNRCVWSAKSVPTIKTRTLEGPNGRKQGADRISRGGWPVKLLMSFAELEVRWNGSLPLPSLAQQRNRHLAEPSRLFERSARS